MTQGEQSRSSGLKFFFAFVGGALSGAIAALLFASRAGAEPRRRTTGAVGSSRAAASSMAGAVREASRDAQTAFAEAVKEYAGHYTTAPIAPGPVPQHHS